MFSLTLKAISYIFSVLIAIASILFLLMIVSLVIKSEDLVLIALESGLPLFIATSLPWVGSVIGVLLLGPITLICTNFFQQTKIIQLLEEQNDELRLARYDRSSAADEA